MSLAKEKNNQNTKILKNQKDFNFSGWFFGVSTGYNLISVKSYDEFQTNYSYPVIQNMNEYKAKTTFSDGNIQGGIHGGYAYQRKSFYTGIELEAKLQNISCGQRSKITYDKTGFLNQGELSTHNLKITLKESYALSLKTGYVFSPQSLIYLKLSAISSRWHINSYYPSFDIQPVLSNPVYSFSKRLYGVLLGTGLETTLTQNVIVSTEISYCKYQKCLILIRI